MDILDRLVRFFTSLRLTVALLGLGLVLVFWGTLAQVQLGLYKAQNEFFRSFFVYWQPPGTGARIPIFPGGYFIGGLLIINLLAAHTRYYRPGLKKIGIALIHLGVVLLLAGQFLTDNLSIETAMHLRNGETKNYSEADRTAELAIIDATDKDGDRVVAVPDRLLATGASIRAPELPFKVRVETYFANSSLEDKPAGGYQQVNASAGTSQPIWWRELPRETEMNKADNPSGVVELSGPQGQIGRFLVSSLLAQPVKFTHNGRNYQMLLRPRRFYKDFSLSLVEFKHDRYAGTDIPKNFSSRVRLRKPSTGEDREVLIYMNSPLRYGGETFYQASYDPDDKGTVLEVVHNPSWLTPYFSCVMVAAGLLFQFTTHLVGFAKKRATA